MKNLLDTLRLAPLSMITNHRRAESLIQDPGNGMIDAPKGGQGGFTIQLQPTCATFNADAVAGGPRQ